MPYTILISNDNNVIATKKQALMQYSSLVDVLEILCPRMYGEHDMSTFDLVMEYKLPISNKLNIETLILTDAEYKDNYLKYSLPITTELTSECGDISIHFSFMKTSLDESDKVIQQVRELPAYKLHINNIESWFVIPDDAVTTLASYYLANKAQIQALNDLASLLAQNKADNIKLDITSGEIYLLSGGKRIGTGIKIEELANEIVEQAGNSQGNIKIVNI